MRKSLDRGPALTDALMQAVFDVMRTDGMTVGDRLPSLKSLAESFGVSVPTLRETIQKMASLGVVEIRHGSGIYVTQTRLPVITGHPHAVERHDQTMFELLDARLVIEPVLARRAAENITKAGADRLQEAIDAAAHALDDGNGSNQHIANMNIHARIAEAAGNPILADTILSMIKVYGTEQKRILAMHGRDARADNHRDHVAIANAVIARDADAAEAAMKRHLARALENVRGILNFQLMGQK